MLGTRSTSSQSPDAPSDDPKSVTCDVDDHVAMHGGHERARAYEAPERAPSKQVVPESRDRQRNLTIDEQLELLAHYALLPVDADGQKIGVAELESSGCGA